MESILKTAHAEPKRKKFSNPDPLSHVMMLDDVEHYIGDYLLSVETILFNSNRFPPEEAIRIVRSGAAVVT